MTGGLSFGAAAEEYERSRPEYPVEAVRWLLPAAARDVVDVGAGTGKLTRQLAARGLAVTAVEPTEGMRAQLRRSVPGVPVLDGTGERIPVAAGSQDAVLFAQAWHWVDPVAGSTEAARVLRPGGRLGLLWNVRDHRVGWVGELDRLLVRAGGTGEHYLDPRVGPPFGEPERYRVAWSHWLDRDGVADLVASRSYVITLPADDRAALLADVRRLLDTHPDVAGRPSIDVPYLTRCYRYARP